MAWRDLEQGEIGLSYSGTGHGRRGIWYGASDGLEESMAEQRVDTGRSDDGHGHGMGTGRQSPSLDPSRAIDIDRLNGDVISFMLWNNWMLSPYTS